MAFLLKTSGLKALGLAGALSFSSLPALADNHGKSEAQEKLGESMEQMEEAARGVAEAAVDATEELMDAIDDLVEELQSYESPTVDEDGNIIIRRRPTPQDNDIET
ncbi:MAG: hypothetical protein ACPG06_09555 [Alphaproteobacteria bacterium]